MKYLLITLICFNLRLSSQVNIPYLNLKISDYFEHYAVSGAIAGWSTSSLYFLTEKNLLSSFGGALFGIGVGLGKEYIWDKALKRGVFSINDIDADIRGVMAAHFVCVVSIDLMEKRNAKLDTTQYNDLAKKVLTDTLNCIIIPKDIR